MNRTQALESAPQYFHTYISKVEDGEIFSILNSQLEDLRTFFEAIPAEKWDYAYAEGKWTVKQVWGHILDTERIFGYRALRFARKDATDLPGYEENDYAAQGNFENRSPESLWEEFSFLRRSNLLLLENLPEGGLERLGTANKLLISVGAIAWILAGHPLHHLGTIRERYL